MTRHNQIIGKWGEKTAEKYLADRGYSVVAVNHRTPFGEIDIIANDADVLVFVEVKTRSSTYLGNPEGSVTLRKQKHIIESAQFYMMNEDQEFDEWRVDVIAITGKPGDSNIDIQLFKNALFS
jgi:putative endonuclease